MACSSKEVRTEYYEDDKTIVHAKSEFLDNKQHGTETVYNKQGKVIQTSEWKNGELNGKMVDYHQNGSVASVANFYNGKLVGRADKYFENGLREQTNYYDSVGRLYNTVMYKPDGSPEEMLPDFYLRKSTTNDSVYFMVNMKNVINPTYLSGILMVGKKFAGDNLRDTLVVVKSEKNDYRFSLTNNQVKEKKLSMQLLYRTILESKDSVDFFSFERNWK